MLEDSNAPESNFHLDLYLRLSESTDILGVIIRCVQLFTTHLRSTTEIIKEKLTHLPMQDFFWVPNCSICRQKEHWDDLHAILYQWFRPNPLCCRQCNHNNSASSSSSLSESLQCDTYLESVIVVYLQGYITMSARDNRQTTIIRSGKTCPKRDFPFLKVAGIFSPHASSEDLLPAVGGGLATEMINGETAKCGLHPNISFEQLGKIMLPKAVHYLRGNAAASSYQMLWKSKHGGAYIRIEETSRRATNRKSRGGKWQKWQDNKVLGWTTGIGEFMGSWVTHASIQLQDPIADWVQTQKQVPLCWR